MKASYKTLKLKHKKTMIKSRVSMTDVTIFVTVIKALCFLMLDFVCFLLLFFSLFTIHMGFLCVGIECANPVCSVCMLFMANVYNVDSPTLHLLLYTITPNTSVLCLFVLFKHFHTSYVGIHNTHRLLISIFKIRKIDRTK